MRERGRTPTTIRAQCRTLRRSRHPCAAPGTSLQCVCTRRRNCIEQLSPSRKYAPGTGRFPARNSVLIKLVWLIPDPGVTRSSSSASQCNRSPPQRNRADRQRLPRRDGSAPPAEPPEGRWSDRKALWPPHIRQSTFRPTGRHWRQQFQSIFAGRRSIFQNLPSPKYARHPARFPAPNPATASLPTRQRFRLKKLCRQIPAVDRPLRPRKKPRDNGPGLRFSQLVACDQYRVAAGPPNL
jgi:hypothetical protein